MDLWVDFVRVLEDIVCGLSAVKCSSSCERFFPFLLETLLSFGSASGPLIRVTDEGYNRMNQSRLKRRL